jgi:hypothetical protein
LVRSNSVIPQAKGFPNIFPWGFLAAKGGVSEYYDPKNNGLKRKIYVFKTNNSGKFSIKVKELLKQAGIAY